MDFDEKFYEEDEFAEGSAGGDEGGTHDDNQPSGEPGGEPGGSTQEDFTTEVLRLRGISDPTKIQFEDENGAVIERSWDQLSKNEQLNIILGDQHPEEDTLSDDEKQLLKAIRKSGSSVEDYLKTYAEENAPEPSQEHHSYRVDELSDDEVYALDLLEKVGSDNITDEELQAAIDAAKQNETLYKKTVEGLRQEYIRLQQDQEAKQQNEAAAKQQAQFQKFATSINSEIQHMDNFMGQELELSQEEKDDLSAFILELDDNGVSTFGRAMQDPEIFTRVAFYLLNEDKITEELTKQMQETYKRGYEQAKKDLNKSTSTSKFVFKPQQKTPEKYADELDW